MSRCVCLAVIFWIGGTGFPAGKEVLNFKTLGPS